MNEVSSPQDHFRMILLTVVGQAFGAAGYMLQERPMHWSRGLFRFVKQLDDSLFGYIDFQVLIYTVEDQPSRFQVHLTRSDQADPGRASTHHDYVRRSLAALVVEDFKVAIVPSGNHWWSYRSLAELGHALGEAGSLTVGFGIPWLSGDLTTPSA